MPNSDLTWAADAANVRSVLAAAGGRCGIVPFGGNHPDGGQAHTVRRPRD